MSRITHKEADNGLYSPSSPGTCYYKIEHYQNGSYLHQH